MGFTAENVPLLAADEHLRPRLRRMGKETLQAFAICYLAQLLQAQRLIERNAAALKDERAA